MRRRLSGPEFHRQPRQGSKHEARAEDSRVRLHGNRFRQADQQTNDSPSEGGVQMKSHVGGQNAQREAAEESSEDDRCRFVRAFAKDHHRGVDGSKQDSAEDPEQNAIHERSSYTARRPTASLLVPSLHFSFPVRRS